MKKLSAIIVWIGGAFILEAFYTVLGINEVLSQLPLWKELILLCSCVLYGGIIAGVFLLAD